MAAAKFDTPELKDIPVVPAIQEGVMAHSSPFIAKPEHQEPLGFPGELVDNWQQVALDKMEDLTHKYRSFKVYLDSCVKCGACTDKCHYYLAPPIQRTCQWHVRIYYVRFTVVTLPLPVSSSRNWLVQQT